VGTPNIATIRARIAGLVALASIHRSSWLVGASAVEVCVGGRLRSPLMPRRGLRRCVARRRCARRGGRRS
jgi:hypothetical protein